MILITVAVIILTIALVVLLASQVELFRDVRDMRDITGLLDQPARLDVGALRGQTLDSIGAPALATSSGVLLILSDRCATCRSLAAALDGAVPPNLQIILTNHGGEPSELTKAWQLDRAFQDVDNRVASTLKISSTPAAVIVADGRIVRAQSVPSTRQLHALLDEVRAAKSPMHQLNGSKHHE